MGPRLVREPLHKQLEEARAAYEHAVAEYRRLMAISAATAHPADPGVVDGTHALRLALRIHSQARLRYEEALRDFANFTLRRTPPARNDGAPVQEDLLPVAVRVLACYTDLPRRTPSEGDVQCLRDAASADEVGLPIDELAVAIIDRERRRRAAR